MSLDYVSQSFEKLSQHIGDFVLSSDIVAYHAVKRRIEDVRQLYLAWIKVYQEYRRGFEKEGLTRSLYPVRRLLSSLGLWVEESFFEVVRFRLPVELYLLLEEYCQRFELSSHFVLAEGRGFESHSVYYEISEELEKLTAPRPVGTQADTFLTSIKEHDYNKMYYESGTFDSPLTWPLLLHELFHSVYDKEKLARLKLSSNATWLPEVVVDLYAATFFGPVYAVSLARYHERFPGGGGVSHPHQGPRLFALLKYLGDMMKQKDVFPNAVQGIISTAFDITSGIWTQYSRERMESQDQVSSVYSEIKEPCLQLFQSKGIEAFETSARNDARAGITFAETIRYFELGIPVSSDPRMLFNALLVSKIEPRPIYVTESLKKWYLSTLWYKSEHEIAETLYSG